MIPPPPLGIETDGSWTTLEAYHDLLDWVASETDATITVLGQSIEGRDIHAIQLGTGPEHGGMLIYAGVHGNEPSGREAAIQLMRDMLVGGNPLWDTLLGEARVTFVPVVNPDGRERNQESNLAGANLNRTLLLLEHPENWAMNQALRMTRPSFTVDMHETSGPGQPPVDFWGLAGWENGGEDLTHPDLWDLGQQAMGQCFSDLQDEGYTTETYWTLTTHPIQHVARSLHSIGVLTESRRILGNFEPEHQIRRTDVQRVAIRSLLDFYGDNHAQIRDAWEASQDWANTSPGPDTVNLTRYTVDPTIQETIAIEGYEIPGEVPASLVEAWELEVIPEGDYSYVPIKQWARRLIPLMFDQRSVARGVEGARRRPRKAVHPSGSQENLAVLVVDGSLRRAGEVRRSTSGGLIPANIIGLTGYGGTL